MKIALATFEYPPFVEGGAGLYAFSLTKNLVKLGHEVHVIAPLANGGKAHEIKDGVFIHRIAFVNRKYLSEVSFWISLRNSLKMIKKQVGDFDIFNGDQYSDFLLKGIECHVLTLHSLISTNVEV